MTCSAVHAAGAVAALAERGLPAGAIAWWMRRPRPQLDGLAPRAALASGMGALVVALAQADAPPAAGSER